MSLYLAMPGQQKQRAGTIKPLGIARPHVAELPSDGLEYGGKITERNSVTMS
jgi:hypothetical protein